MPRGDGTEIAVPSNGTDRGGGHFTGSSTATCSVQPESGCYWVSWVSVLARFDACNIPLREGVQQYIVLPHSQVEPIRRERVVFKTHIHGFRVLISRKIYRTSAPGF